MYFLKKGESWKWINRIRESDFTEMLYFLCYLSQDFRANIPLKVLHSLVHENAKQIFLISLKLLRIPSLVGFYNYINFAPKTIEYLGGIANFSRNKQTFIFI